jgi:N6-adenosine-specific RNA methylase IME4
MASSAKHIPDIAMVMQPGPSGCTDLLIICVCPVCRMQGNVTPTTGPTNKELILAPVSRTVPGMTEPITSHQSSGYGTIRRVSPGPYLELFARRKRPGWHVCGDQAASDVEL